MKPFDLEEFKRTGKAITRDGKKVEFLYYDERLDFPLGAVIEYPAFFCKESFKKDGKEFYEGTSDHDLFMPDDEVETPKEITFWVNVYQEQTTDSEVKKGNLYRHFFESYDEAKEDFYILESKKITRPWISSWKPLKIAHKVTISLNEQKEVKVDEEKEELKSLSKDLCRGLEILHNALDEKLCWVVNLIKRTKRKLNEN